MAEMFTRSLNSSAHSDESWRRLQVQPYSKRLDAAVTFALPKWSNSTSRSRDGEVKTYRAKVKVSSVAATAMTTRPAGSG